MVVAANQSVKSATRLSAIPGFASLVTAFLTGILARYTRRLKPIIIAGFCLEVLGLGLMIKFRTATNSQAEIAVVQAIRGMGVGMISFPVQAAIQSASTHDRSSSFLSLENDELTCLRIETAAITAGYLTIYYLSSGIGSSIGGGIWTNSVPQKLNQYLTNQTLAAMAYANPIGFISTYAPGTPERMAVARAQDETQASFPLFFLLRNCSDLIRIDSGSSSSPLLVSAVSLCSRRASSRTFDCPTPSRSRRRSESAERWKSSSLYYGMLLVSLRRCNAEPLSISLRNRSSLCSREISASARNRRQDQSACSQTYTASFSRL